MNSEAATLTPNIVSARILAASADGDLARAARLRPLCARLESLPSGRSLRLGPGEAVAELSAEAPLQLVAPALLPERELQAALAFRRLEAVRQEFAACSLAGKLALVCGQEAGLAALSVAATMSGAAALTLEADAARLRAWMRLGWIDIVVNSADEALRILKLSIRKGENIAVGLQTSPTAALQGFVERGLLPDLWLSGGGEPCAELQTLLSRGMRRVEALRPAPEVVAATIAAPDGRRSTLQTLLQSVLSASAGDSALAGWLAAADARLRSRSLPARSLLLPAGAFPEVVRSLPAPLLLVGDFSLSAPCVAQAVDERGRVRQSAYLILNS